jgi:hypothetical protein
MLHPGKPGKAALATAIRINAVPLLIVLSLAVLSAQLSFRLRADTLLESFHLELDALRGHARYPEFQNRLIAPALLAALRWLMPENMPDRAVWYLSRILQAAVAWWVLYGVCLHLTGRRSAGLVAVGLVTFAYLWTPMSHPFEYTSDFLDVMFAALMVLCALEERRLALAVAVVLAALNRESAAFAGIVWLSLLAARHGLTARRAGDVALGLLYIALAAAVVLGVRLAVSAHYDPRQQIGLLEFLEDLHALGHPTGVVPMLFFTLLLYGACLARLPRPWTAEQKGLILAAALCTAISSIFGILGELRVLLPSWVMLAIAIVIGRRPQSDREWVASLL